MSNLKLSVNSSFKITFVMFHGIFHIVVSLCNLLLLLPFSSISTPNSDSILPLRLSVRVQFWMRAGSEDGWCRSGVERNQTQCFVLGEMSVRKCNLVWFYLFWQPVSLTGFIYTKSHFFIYFNYWLHLFMIHTFSKIFFYISISK